MTGALTPSPRIASRGRRDALGQFFQLQRLLVSSSAAFQVQPASRPGYQSPTTDVLSDHQELNRRAFSPKSYHRNTPFHQQKGHHKKGSASTGTVQSSCSTRVPVEPAWLGTYLRTPIVTQYSLGTQMPRSVGKLSWNAMKSRRRSARRASSRLVASDLVGP